MTPQRIQLSRLIGWRKPPNTIVVARPSKWGNPFRYRTNYGLARVPAINGDPWEYEGRISAPGNQHDCYHPDGTWTRHTVRYLTRAECVELYRTALTHPTRQLQLWDLRTHRALTVDDARRELAGQNLACWCPLINDEGQPVPCHADVLLEACNESVVTR